MTIEYQSSLAASQINMWIALLTATSLVLQLPQLPNHYLLKTVSQMCSLFQIVHIQNVKPLQSVRDYSLMIRMIMFLLATICKSLKNLSNKNSLLNQMNLKMLMNLIRMREDLQKSFYRKEGKTNSYLIPKTEVEGEEESSKYQGLVS